MEIGAPKNAKNHEDSVGLTPAGVLEIAMRRHGIGMLTAIGIAFDADTPVTVLPVSIIALYHTTISYTVLRPTP